MDIDTTPPPRERQIRNADEQLRRREDELREMAFPVVWGVSKIVPQCP